MKAIFAYHYGEPGGSEDEEVLKVFRCHDGRHIGTGVFLPTGERDVHYDVDDERAEQCALELLRCGYKVRMYPALEAQKPPLKLVPQD